MNYTSVLHNRSGLVTSGSDLESLFSVMNIKEPDPNSDLLATANDIHTNSKFTNMFFCRGCERCFLLYKYNILYLSTIVFLEVQKETCTFLVTTSVYLIILYEKSHLPKKSVRTCKVAEQFYSFFIACRKSFCVLNAINKSEPP